MDKLTQSHIIAQARGLDLIRSKDDILSALELSGQLPMTRVRRGLPKPLRPNTLDALLGSLSRTDSLVLGVLMASGFGAFVIALTISVVLWSLGLSGVSFTALVCIFITLVLVATHILILDAVQAGVIQNIWRAQLEGATPQQLDKLATTRQFKGCDLAKGLFAGMKSDWRAVHEEVSAQTVMGWDDPRAADRVSPMTTVDLAAIVAARNNKDLDA